MAISKENWEKIEAGLSGEEPPVGDWFSAVELDANDADLITMLDKIPDKAEITGLNFSNNEIGDTGAKYLAEKLPEFEGITWLRLTGNQIGDEGACALAKAIRQNPSLPIDTIYIRDNPVGEAGIKAMASMLRHNRFLTSLMLDDDGVSAEVAEEAASIILNSGNKNILDFGPMTPTLEAYCEANKDKAQEWLEHMETIRPEQFNIEDLCDIANRRAALQEEATGGKIRKLERSLSFLDSLPRQMPGRDEMTLEGLTTPDKNGICALDNPYQYFKFPQVAMELALKGTPLTKEILFAPNREGNPHILSAAVFGELGGVILALNGNREYITPADLMRPDGTHTPLMEAAIDTHTLGEIFTKENFREQDAGMVRRLYQTLPDEAKAQVPNYHALISRVHARPLPGRERG